MRHTKIWTSDVRSIAGKIEEFKEFEELQEFKERGSTTLERWGDFSLGCKPPGTQKRYQGGQIGDRSIFESDGELGLCDGLALPD